MMRYLLIFIACFSGSMTNTLGQGRHLARKINDSTMLTSDGVALYLKVSGKGTPCIFVHGGPGAWSRSFEAMGGDVLEKQLTMYYYDQRGSGRSASSPDNDYSLNRMVEDIEDIRSLTGSDQVYLVAHSFGGVLASEYAARYGDHVKGLILLNATLSINYSLRAQIAFVNQLLGSHVTVENEDSVLPSFLAAMRLLGEKHLRYKMLSDNKATVHLLDSIDRSMPRNYSFARRALEMPEYAADFTKETAGVHVPVLVITGTKDHNIGPDHYKLFRFLKQTVKVIEGGHVLYYERNRQFAETVFGFVADAPDRNIDLLEAAANDQ